MRVAPRFAAPRPFGHALRDPIFEVGDRLGADAEFDEMKGHLGIMARRDEKTKPQSGEGPLGSSPGEGETGRRQGARHAPATEIDSLADKMEKEAKFPAEHSTSARAIVDFCRSVDREIKIATVKSLDMKITLAARVIAVTVLGIGAHIARIVDAWDAATLPGCLEL